MLTLFGRTSSAQTPPACPDDGFEGRNWYHWTAYETVDGCDWQVEYCLRELPGSYDPDAMFILQIKKRDPNCIPTKPNADVINDVKEAVFNDPNSGLSPHNCDQQFIRYYMLLSASCWSYHEQSGQTIDQITGETSTYTWSWYEVCPDYLQHYCKKVCDLCWYLDNQNYLHVKEQSCFTTQVGSPTCSIPVGDWDLNTCYLICQP